MASRRAAGGQRPPPLSDAASTERQKRAAASAAAELVQDGMRLGRGPARPWELVGFGVGETLAALDHARLRDCQRSPDGGLIADYLGPVEDPRKLSLALSATPGVVERGPFAPELVSTILIGSDSGVGRRLAGGPAG